MKMSFPQVFSKDSITVVPRSRFYALIWMALCLMLSKPLFATGLAMDMKVPVAYCLSNVNVCTPDKQIPLNDTVPDDLRALNGSTQNPVTLVYPLPNRTNPSESVISQPDDYYLLFAARFINYCFRFDNQNEVTCTKKTQTQIKVPEQATQVLTQQVEAPDTRIMRPFFVFGTAEGLQEKIQSERNPILILFGWYAFLTLVAMAQTLTRRNQMASLALAGLSFTMLLRLLVYAPYGYADVSFINSQWDKFFELSSICCIGIFATEFYGRLVGKQWLTARRIFQSIGLLIIASCLLVQSPEHALVNLYLAQLHVLFLFVFLVLSIRIAFQQWTLWERRVLFLGVLIASAGGLFDLIMSFYVIEIPPIFAYTFAFETLCQCVLLALRNDSAHIEARRLQQANLDAQAQLLESLRESERTLHEKVEQRTAELRHANQQISSALQEAQAAKERAETEQQQAKQALTELKATQTQLIAAEKMASLGLLVSNVAHEINTPIGAVKSSGTLIADALDSALTDMPKLFSILDPVPRGLFVQLIASNKTHQQTMSTREERTLVKQMTTLLESAKVEHANRKARLLLKLRAHHKPLDYLPLLQHDESHFILDVASNIANIISSTYNISSAVEKVSRVVYALKTLSGNDRVQAFSTAPLQLDIDKALAHFQNQMQKVTLIRQYQPDMLPIYANHEALGQLCMHLVMNALQAMSYSGTLVVGLSTLNNQATISVTDSGSGIDDAIRDRIFEPFFSTRTSGEGSGMGLAVVKRIVEQHHGSITIQSEIAMGTTVMVTLPHTQTI